MGESEDKVEASPEAKMFSKYAKFFPYLIPLLIGGSLYEAGDALYERSRVFAEGVRRFAAEPSGDGS